MLGVALARRAGLLEATTTFRAIGACVGLMTLVTGNFLPKLRPLGAQDGQVARVARAERRGGWTLAFMGLALFGLFLFAPLPVVRLVSPVVALGGVGLIELDWIWTAWIARSPSGEAVRSRSEVARERRTVAGWMLFGLAYVLVTASLKLLSDDSPRIRELGSWALVGFTITFSVLYAVVDVRRRGWHSR
jgi:hypothetical protein